MTPLIKDLNLIWSAKGGMTRVLVYGMNRGAVIPAGTTELFAIAGKVKLAQIEAADYYASPVEIEIGTPAPAALPSKYYLTQNHPNPFNATTQIGLALPVDSKVSLRIYNLTGQVVKVFEEFMTAGYKTITWDGANNQGEKVASGVYFYRLQVGNYSEVKKMTLLK